MREFSKSYFMIFLDVKNVILDFIHSMVQYRHALIVQTMLYALEVKKLKYLKGIGDLLTIQII